MDSKDMYVIENGCVIKKKGYNFVVSKNNEKIIEMPYSKVNKLILIGSQSITPQAVEFALEKEKNIFFLNKYGKVKGIIQSSNRKNVFLRLAQYELWRDKEKRLEFAKAIVAGKVKNQNKFLKKYRQTTFDIEHILNKINAASDINILLGIEGECSKKYFGNFDNIILGDLKFEKRTRRPPENEFNALLSLTYTLTKNNILYNLEEENLDSYIGYLHSVKYGRESLALDVLETFRSYCDYLVIKWINRKEFKKYDFKISEDGIFLTDNGFRKYLQKYNKEFSEVLKEQIKLQISYLKKTVLDNTEYKMIDVKY